MIHDPGATRARQRPTPDQALELANEAVELADRVGSQALLLHQLRRSTSTPDGIRSSTRFDGSVGHGHGGHADPVGTLVAAEVDAANEGNGPSRRAYNECVDALEATVVLLRSATQVAGAVLEPVRHPVPDDGCTSHAAHGFLGVPTRSPGGDLCRWCADFWRRYRQRPSKADLQALEERRIDTEQMRSAA